LQLHLGVKTVETHRVKIRRKLRASCSADVFLQAIQWRLYPGGGPD
jgi:DNA-binding NarL/FixJ family response regulator